MSNFSKELWDTDIKHFAEEYSEDICNVILKIINGEYDEDVVSFEEEYGEECFNAIKKLIADELKGEELRGFIEEYSEDFVNDIKALVDKRVFASKNMNSLIFNFLPSKIRGVYRFDASISEIESKDDVSTYVEHKLSFIPSEYASLFADIAGSASTGAFYSNKVIQDNPHHSSLRGKIKEYFSNYPYFNNHVDGEDKESVNWLEAQFVRKILAPILTPAGMLKVEPQKEVRRRKPDFAVEGEKKYVFEVDGFGKFKQRSDLDNFLRRQNMLAAAGWIVYRFSYTDIIQHSAVTKRVIYDIFKNDPALKSFLCDSSQISLFEDTTSPSLTADPFEIVNSFYLVQDYFAGQLVENGWDSGTRINIQDGFTFDFPFVATALSALYKFLNSIEKICEVDFDLPEISVLGSTNNNSLQLHPLIKISHSADDTSEIEITPAVIRQNKPSLINLLTDNSEVSVNFRSNLDLQTIKEGLAYITDSIFKYKGGTNEFQNPTLKEIFDKKDVLGIFPTGSGKSFCFWLPALIKPGITLVICPLKSLMRDQCSTLENYGIYSAAYITSDIKDKVEREQIILDAMLGKIKILYVAPERIRINKFLNDLERLQEFVKINYLVIDEAHCISEWGHDFRPSYLNIPFFFQKLKMKNPGIQLIALTATAGQMIRKDIVNILHLHDGEGGNVKAAKDFDRKEFSYQIVPVRNNNEKQEAFETTLLESIPIALKTTELDEVLQNTNHRREKGVGIIYSIYADPHGMHSVYDGIAHYMYQTKALLGEYGENNHYGLNDYGTGRVRAFSSKSPTLCPNCNSYNYVAYPKAPKQRNEEEEVEEDEDIENAELKGGRKKCRDCGHVFILNSKNAVRPTNYDKQTRKNQEDFKKGAIDILVATKGFGMGIDKGSVRFVLHTSLSSGIESWYQEAGRAGRDSERAHCVILADLQTDQCINDLNKKIVKMPPCYNNCPYGRESLCDYGKQHVFIKRSYPGIESDVISIVKTFDQLINAFFNTVNEEEWVTFKTHHTKLKSHELALFRLKLLGIVQDFFVEYKDGVHFKVRLNICKNTEGKITINTRHDYLVANLIRYLNQNKLYSGDPDRDESSISKKTNECKAKHDFGITERLERLSQERKLLHYEDYKSFYHNIINYLFVILDHTYTDILRMRYQSLWDLFRVVQNEDNECRRPLILGNFGAQLFEPGYRCNLCDACIDDLDFPVESRIPPAQTQSMKELQTQLEEAFFAQTFDFNWLVNLWDALKDYPRDVFRQSCGVLEGNPVNFTALFFCREFAPDDEKEAYSHRLLETANRHLDFEDITRIFSTSPNAYKINLFFLLNDKYGKMNNEPGIRWIYEESKKLLKTGNDKRLYALHETLGFLYLTDEMENTYTGRLNDALKKLEVMANG